MAQQVSSLTLPCVACGTGITVPRPALMNAVAKELILCDSCNNRKLQSFAPDVQKKITGILRNWFVKLTHLKDVATSLGDEEFSSLIGDYEARINAGRCWDNL